MRAFCIWATEGIGTDIGIGNETAGPADSMLHEGHIRNSRGIGADPKVWGL